MPSFFTAPASQRKRKRNDTAAPAAKKRSKIPTGARKPQKEIQLRASRDESISGSESEEEGRSPQGSGLEDGGDSSGTDHDGETGAERRLRLAERYLENIKEEVDEVGYDAADIDRDLIAERLKEDVAETKGRLYRRIASGYSFSSATYARFRADTHSTAAVATCPPYVYTVSKDMTLIKWEIPEPPSSPESDSTRKTATLNGTNSRKPAPSRRRPKRIACAKGNKNMVGDNTYQGHVDAILTVAASQDGRFVVTGGRDRRLIVWDAAELKPLRVFTQHRDSVTGVVFRRGTNQLYSSSKDRTIKLWSLNELAYVETLFGHQDEVTDIAALAQENCVSVGARDRTARLWKVVDETQLVFRGGGGEKKNKSLGTSFAEGSIDRVAMVDEEMFVTGSDNGSLSLWTIHKKKPIFTLPLAHGLDPPPPPEEASAEQEVPIEPLSAPQPRWITALTTIPYSDLILSGSWDGQIRVWKISDDKRRIEAVETVGRAAEQSAHSSSINGRIVDADIETPGGGATAPLHEEAKIPAVIPGIINGIAIIERGDRGKDGIYIVAAVGSEHRLGRWIKKKGKSGAVGFEVSRTPLLLKESNGEGGEHST
ncbi:MAG: pre-rRNA processing protein [Candelina mexicana]|nr:MAG: pre-rRNA processing protein [Candelina mexicana]